MLKICVPRELRNFEENRQNPTKDEIDSELWAVLERLENNAANLRIDPPKLLRKRRAPSEIEECLGGNALSGFDKDIASYYRKIYYETLDCVTNAITDCFDKQDFETWIKSESLLFQAAKGYDFHTEYRILSIYRKDFYDNRFQVQPETLSGIL